ncbi:hypothetical protein BDP27DRAFT_1371700 [Rhodocollybia butyracea]|uniref:Uncharacterized protein n=1 Tax=Rhodocollybia butyracea TaxID=206335 RepID=A0A9P5TYE8_9AGAR|nr:hypothetical protein BDP27DRAFT_1371700 [Rhodocollybia butyracea]
MHFKLAFVAATLVTFTAAIPAPPRSPVGPVAPAPPAPPGLPLPIPLPLPLFPVAKPLRRRPLLLPIHPPSVPGVPSLPPVPRQAAPPVSVRPILLLASAATKALGTRLVTMLVNLFPGMSFKLFRESAAASGVKCVAATLGAGDV